MGRIVRNTPSRKADSYPAEPDIGTVSDTRPIPAPDMSGLLVVASTDADEPRWLWHGTVPSLNGLRALSIAVVILSHLFDQAQIPIAYLPVPGQTGVDVFFVISGFLITLLLIREQRQMGAISIRRFYARRALRIFPAYFVYLGVMSALAALGIVALSTKQLLAAATYTANLFPGGTWVVGHCWSLCVEEHFYLIWPMILVLCGRHWASRIATVYVCLTPLLRVILRFALRDTIALWSFTLTRMDAIAVGCCLAFIATSPRLRARLRLAPRQASLVVLGGTTFLLASHQLTLHALRSKAIGYYAAFAGGTVNAIVIAAIVWGCICNPTGTVGKFLNAKPVVNIGILSYSLYLWQQPFTDPFGTDRFCSFPINVVLLSLCAAGSYYLIERPFLTLKQRLVPG